MPYQPDTVSEAFNFIDIGQKTPWIAIGDFLDDFYRAKTTEEKYALVKDPITTNIINPENLRWASFLAAAVDWLCRKYGVATPDWIHRAEYFLKQPWFLYSGWQLRAWLLVSTPPPFLMRNIFCGDRALERV